MATSSIIAISAPNGALGKHLATLLESALTNSADEINWQEVCLPFNTTFAEWTAAEKSFIDNGQKPSATITNKAISSNLDPSSLHKLLDLLGLDHKIICLEYPATEFVNQVAVHLTAEVYPNAKDAWRDYIDTSAIPVLGEVDWDRALTDPHFFLSDEGKIFAKSIAKKYCGSLHVADSDLSTTEVLTVNFIDLLLDDKNAPEYVNTILEFADLKPARLQQNYSNVWAKLVQSTLRFYTT